RTIEEQLGAVGLSLRLEHTDMNQRLADWLAAGMPGARDAYADPVEQRVSGLVARLPSGETLGIRPTPRRAVGPDLGALVYGMQGRCMQVEQATLCVWPKQGS